MGVLQDAIESIARKPSYLSESHKSTSFRRSSLYLTLVSPKAAVGMYTCLPLLVVAGFAGVAVAAPIVRALPTPVSVATAKTYLADLTVAVDSNSPAYARTEFKTWDISPCLARFALVVSTANLRLHGLKSPENVTPVKVSTAILHISISILTFSDIF